MFAIYCKVVYYAYFFVTLALFGLMSEKSDPYHNELHISMDLKNQTKADKNIYLANDFKYEDY